MAKGLVFSMDLTRFIGIFNLVTAVVFAACYFYQYIFMFLYFILSAREKKKSGGIKQDHKETGSVYAAIICGRNEEAVIGDLIDCLNAQSYSKKITTFVMADNCSDRTAEVAREHGAVVYERDDLELIGKGYAMDLLFKNIERDYPDRFDGFFVFDADNILPADFVSKMDEKVAEGFDIITGFRNTKNYGYSWISASNGLWYMRENRFMNQTRSMLGLSCYVTGTGFYISKKLVGELGGWPYHTLTEDAEFSVDQITRGKKIGFCPDAQVYDEQTVRMRQSWRQRLRWSRGYLQVLRRHGAALVKGVFKGSFSCYDMAMSIAPAFAITTVSVVVNVVVDTIIIATGGDIIGVLMSLAQMFVGMYNAVFLVGLLASIANWDRIKAKTSMKIFSIIMLPLFMFTYIPIAMESLFVKPGWKPIAHSASRKELESRSEAEKLPAAE